MTAEPELIVPISGACEWVLAQFSGTLRLTRARGA
jgi:hypothetical protein